MATVTTTTVSNPLIYPSQTQIERVRSGDLWVMVAATTANTYELWRSQNAGASWTLALSTVRANLVEIGCIQVQRAPYNQLIWCYRTYETGADRVWVRTISDLGASSLAWNTEVPAASAVAGSAGAVLSGIDIQNVVAGGQIYVIVGLGVQNGANRGAHFNILTGSTLASLSQNNNLFTGTRLWTPEVGTGRVTPSVDIEHSGDGHSSNTPHLWMCWGRTQAWAVKCSWTGNGWSGPSAPVQLNPITLTPAQDSVAGRWDGARFVTAVPDPAATSVVTVFERNQANSTTTIRQTPTHPTGVVRNCTIGWNSVTGDLRVFAVGTSTTVLYYVDYVRATGVWSSWTQVTATAVLGATGNNYSVRRGTDGRYEVLTAHSGAPNTIVHTAQSLSYAPNAPTWDTAAMQLPSGASADVNVPLILDWTFSDPDPADTQGSYAVSRQIGAGALAYWRASDSTWQAAEVQNTSATSTITLPAPWGSGTDAATTFKAKTWDAAAVAGPYGDGYVVVPSTVVNPAISSPTPATVITADNVTVVWTAAEQVAWRARIAPLGAADTFTGRSNGSSWGSGEYGGAWTVNGTASDYNVASGAATQSNGTVGTLRSAFIDTLSNDHTVYADVSVPVTNAAAQPITKWVFGRVADTSNYYTAVLSLATTGALSLTLQKRVLGSISTVGSSGTLGTGHASGEVWRIVLDCQGQTIRCKAWRISGTAQAEPEYQVSASDASLTAGTKVGAGSRLETGNTNTTPVVFTFDNVYALLPTYYDSGWQNTSATSWQAPARLGDLTAWALGVRTRNLEALASTEQLTFVTVDYVEPPAATLAATPAPSNGTIDVVVTNPAAVGAQPAILSQDVYARANLGPNLLTNPGFEVNTTGWTGTGGTLTRSTAQFHSGTAAGLITPDGVTAAPKVTAAAAQLMAVAEGQQVTADGWLRPATANKPITFGIDWFDVSNALVTSTVVTYTPLAGAWLYVQVTAAVPAGVSVVKAGPRYGLTTTPAAGDLLYGDDLRIRAANTDTGILVASAVGTGVTVRDWHAVSGTDYEYRVLTRGVNGASILGPWTA